MKIAFLVPYFGKWPIWFPAFLKSCESNPTITWIFFTDCDISVDKPTNVIFNASTLEAVKQLASAKMGFEISLNNPRKLCDLKPAYGHVFGDYLKEYDYWGFCDIDIIWGNIRGFITDELLSDYEIITSLKETISGHFTLFKNTKINALLYSHNGVFKSLFQQQKYQWFDENAFAKIVTELKSANSVKVYWYKELLEKGIESVAQQEYVLDKWVFEKGRVFELVATSKKEYMYLHFLNWKKTMKVCEVNFSDSPKDFYISYSKIHYNKHSKFEVLFNSVKNLFDGYYLKLRRKQRIKKIKSLQKRIIKKIQKFKG